jgi:hypothetical protein
VDNVQAAGIVHGVHKANLGIAFLLKRHFTIQKHFVLWEKE